MIARPMSLLPPRRRLLETRLLPLLLLVNLLLLLYYLAVDYRFMLHSDSAVMNLLAQEIVDSGQWFPRDWNYANGDLWVWFTQAAIVPLLYLLPNSFALHTAACLLTAALVLLATWRVGAMLGQSRLARLACLALMAGGISVNMAENLYGQAAYGTLFYLGALLACASWSCLQANGPARWRWGALAALLALLVFWSNPQRAAVFYALPLLAALLALQLAGGAGRPAPRHALGLLLALLVGMAAGAALHGHYIRLVGSSGLPPATWLGFDAMLRNLQGTLRGLLSLLGGVPPPGAKVVSAAGVKVALRLLAALVLLALLPWTLRRALRTAPHRGRLFFAVFAFSALAVNLFIACTTSVADMSDPEASVRYLAPALLYALLLLTGIAVDEFRWSRPAPVAAVLAVLTLAVGAPANYKVDFSPGYFPAGGALQHHGFVQLGIFLERQGLHYGYASFWNAGRMTVLTGGLLKVRQIRYDNGLPVPERHLASDRWFRPETWRGDSFLLLHDSELKSVDWDQLARYAGAPARTLHQQDWTIVVYPHNLAARLPFWDHRQPQALHLPVGPATLHAVGQLQGDSLLAEPGQSGYLRYGPGRTGAAGNYRADFSLDAAGPDGADLGVVDVTIGGGAVKLASHTIRAGGPHTISLPFRLDGPVGDLEFRVWSSGAGRLRAGNIDLNALDPRLQP